MLILCMVLHYIADFLLQSREMGKKKSTEPKWLYGHIAIQFFVFVAGLIFFMDPLRAVLFSLTNALIHGVIDQHMWQLYKYIVAYKMLKNPNEVYFDSDAAYHSAHHALENGDKRKFVELAAPSWKYWEDHSFYAVIGLDQLLHVCTIILLFSML